jgi:hypothetical protein
VTDDTINDTRQLALPFPTPPKRDLVAFWSPAPQSGKSTAAKLFAGRAGTGAWFTQRSFAAPVRRLAYDLALHFGEDAQIAYSTIIEGIDKEVPMPVLGKSAVDWLICVGTKLGREFVGPDVWVSRMECLIEADTVDGEGVVIDDVRFPNERDMIRRMGGVLIGIRRPGATVSEARRAAEGLLTFDDMDAVIDNDGSIEQFRERVLRVSRDLGLPV